MKEIKAQAQAETGEIPEKPQDKVESEPIGVTLSRAHGDVTIAILEIQYAYGLPAYLTDLIVTAALSDIRACANKDIIHAMKTVNE